MGKTASPKAKPKSIISKNEFSLNKGEKPREIRKMMLLIINKDILMPIMEENILLILFGSLFFSVTYLAAYVLKPKLTTITRYCIIAKAQTNIP